MKSSRTPRYLVVEEASQVLGTDLDEMMKLARKKNRRLIFVNQSVAGLRNSRLDLSQTALSQPGITISFQQKARYDIEELVYTFQTGMIDFSLVWKPMDRPDGWEDRVIPEYGEEEGVGETWNTARAVATARGTGREVSFGSMVAQETSKGRDLGIIDGVTNRTQQSESQERARNTGHDTARRVQDIRSSAPGNGRRVSVDEIGSTASNTESTSSSHATGTDRKHERQHTQRSSQSVKQGMDRKESHSFRNMLTQTETDSLGGSRTRKNTLTYRHHLLPVTREEWYPHGLLYSLPEQYAMTAKVLRMLGVAEILICWGNEPTRFCRVDQLSKPFDGLSAMKEWKVRTFNEWLWSIHPVFFTVQRITKCDAGKEKKVGAVNASKRRRGTEGLS